MADSSYTTAEKVAMAWHFHIHRSSAVALVWSVVADSNCRTVAMAAMAAMAATATGLAWARRFRILRSSAAMVVCTMDSW